MPESEPPRRRRSVPPPSRRSPQGPGLLPTIALGIGVVVAGLGIGAFLSAIQSHGGKTTSTAATAPTPQGLPLVTPVARATRGPVAIATVVAHPTPTPTPRPTPKPTPTPNATPTAVASVKPAATATPRATSTPTAAPAEAATPKATPRATPTPIVITPPPATPGPVPTPPAIARTTAPAVTSFAAQAQSTVRRYLDALIAGNENGAYAALGSAPGDPNAQLSEEAFVNRGTRITSMRTTRVDGSGATVEVELSSSHGTYYATYHVANGPSGAVIDQHDYIKV